MSVIDIGTICKSVIKYRYAREIYKITLPRYYSGSDN